VFANEIGFGPGKRYPGGPTTVVNGKEFPCVFAASPSASMTDKILAMVMKRLDDFGLTYRDEVEGVYPMLIMDGHGSRLGLEFLRYVNNKDTKGMVMVGAPYATQKWQFHDDKR
jgi:hypothetical protein